jgi:hypothetical protein
MELDDEKANKSKAPRNMPLTENNLKKLEN